MFGLRLLDAAVLFKTDTFINTDTFFNTEILSQNYLNSYTLSKKQFVEWLRQQSNKIQVINLKLQHMYGPMDDKAKFVPWVVNQFRQQVNEVKLTRGEQLRDFIYIDDVVSAYLIALKKTAQLQCFNEFDVGTGKMISVRTFVESLKLAYEKQYGACEIKLNFGALPYRIGEMMSVEVNNSKTIQLGWSTRTSLADGVMKIIVGQKLNIL